MRKPGVEVSKQDYMEASLKFYLADRSEDLERADKLNNEAVKLLGFADYEEFEAFHEDI